MKQFSRRALLNGAASLLTIASVATASFPTKAGLRLHGSTPAALPAALPLRNVINLNDWSFGTNEYAFIDHIRNGVNTVGPFGPSFSPPANPTFPSVIDADGWPNNASASGLTFGAGFNVPDPVNFGGPYIVDFFGNGAVGFGIQFPLLTVGTFVVGNVINGMPAPVNCTVTTGINSISITGTGGASQAVCYFTMTSTSTGPQSMSWGVSSTGSGGFFVKKVRWYRSSEATDLANGLIFRNAWKQPLVNLCPSAIRTMNVLCGNTDFNGRFENRTLPNNAGYCKFSQWTTSPSYSTNATGTNQYVCAAATPTAANTKTTPASMVHREIATVRHTNGFTRTGNGSITISSITNATNGVVTTSSAHGYNTGDIIQHQMSMVGEGVGIFNSTTSVTNYSGDLSHVQNGMFVYGAGIQAGTIVSNISGTTITLSKATTISGSNMSLGFRCMKSLHFFPCTITVTGSSTYQLNVDTTAFGPFGSNLGSCTQFISLQVGSGNDRVAYPCMFDTALAPASAFGPYLNANDYKTWYFDKTISGQTDGAGNYIMGAWMFATTPNLSNIGHSGDFPIEVMVQMINELNAMSPAHTIGLWMNIPCWGLSSMDPDHTTGSDWAVNAVDVVMNPSSTVRASGYSALGYSGATQLNTPNLILEYSNELWPSGTNDGRAYLISAGIQRWGQAIEPQNLWQDLKALRSTCWVRDVKASNPPGSSRITYVLGIWGSIPVQPGDFGGNYATLFGGAVTATPNQIGDWYTNDTLVTSGSWGRPIDNLNGWCGATYFNPPDAYYDGVGKGTQPDDCAMYFGADNSGALSFTGSVGWAGTAHGTNSTNVITVDTVTSGVVGIGDVVNGSGFNNGAVTITGFLTGTGGTGTYSTNTSVVQTSPVTVSVQSFTLAVTGTVTNGPLVAGQVFVGTGVQGGATILSQRSGTAGGAGIYAMNTSFGAQTTPAAGTFTSPNTTLSFTATIAGTTMTVTGSPTLPLLPGQFFSGAGVAANTFISRSLSGGSGAGLYQLNQASTVASPTTMTNIVGGNYIGAANQSQALANFVLQNVNPPVNFTIFSGQSQSTNFYSGNVLPQNSSALPAGKVFLNYEGGQQWNVQIGKITSLNGYRINPADSLFGLAAQQSSQWGVGQTNFFNAANAIANCYMPSIYIWINGQWAYCSPDTYSLVSGTPTEGAALTVNNPAWINWSARNQALPS